MISANELRLGNWVQNDAGVYWQLESFNVLARLFSEDGKQIVEPFPIPLTPEILEKCGFAGKYKSCGYSYTKGIVKLSSQDVDDLDNPIENYQLHFYNNHQGAPIYFLHQLQNLYFALTGTELQYTP